VRGLPKAVTKHFQVFVLLDPAFGRIELSAAVRRLQSPALAGVRCHRQLEDGPCVAHLHKRGQQVRVVGLKLPVSLSWYYLNRNDRKVEKRFVLSTKPLKGTKEELLNKQRPVNHDYPYPVTDPPTHGSLFIYVVVLTISWWGKKRCQIQGWSKTAKHRFG